MQNVCATIPSVNYLIVFFLSLCHKCIIVPHNCVNFKYHQILINLNQLWIGNETQYDEMSFYAVHNKVLTVLSVH